MKEKMQFIGVLAGACVFLLAILMSNILGVKKTSVKAKSANSAVVIKEGSCLMLDGNGDQQYFTPDNMPNFHAVITKESNGNINATCKGNVTPSSAKKGAIHWNIENQPEVFCILGGYPPYYTTDWSEVVTPNGNATLKCQYHSNSQ
jgi:hypothetical protein